ncbi:hypothetical protein LTR17_013327 [Elasticomyces elasticus]|nr:hypothetical protein LTR17_013327 [Elasticomyces elasticus]
MEAVSRLSEDQRNHLPQAIQFMKHMLFNLDHNASFETLQDFAHDIAPLAPLSHARDGIEHYRVLLLDRLQSVDRDTTFELFCKEHLRQALIYGQTSWRTRSARAAHEFAVATDAISPFPFMKLPPELRNHVYELCIPRNKTFTLPSDCGHQADDDPPIQPEMTRVSRAMRTESLAMFYATNSFQYHAMRCNFSALIAHCNWIGMWDVKMIRQVEIYIGEMAWEGEVFVIKCAEGLWEPFKWAARSGFVIGETRCSSEGNFDPVSRALKLALSCRYKGKEGTTDKDDIDENESWEDEDEEEEDGKDKISEQESYGHESDLRAVFDGWLVEQDLRCTCKVSEWREDREWLACSQHTPLRDMVDYKCVAKNG